MLTDIIKVNIGFTLGLGAEIENKTQAVGNSDGQIQLIESRYNTKTISIPFSVEASEMGRLRELMGMLNVREPSQLWFSSEPDKYYMALPSSNSLTEDWQFGSGTLEFLCIDPFAHAITPKTFTNSGDVITINNEGTVPTPVSFNITNKGDNGYFGLVNENSTIKIGNPDEIDGYDYKNNEVLLDHDFKSADELTGWQMNTVKSSYYKPTTLSGSFGVRAGTNQDLSVYVSDYSAGSDKSMWFGPSMYKKIKADSFGNTDQENFIFYSLVGAQDKVGDAFGVQSLDIVDKDKKMICGFYFRKLNWSTRDMQLYFYVGDKIVMKWEDTNAYLMRDFIGGITIEKHGADFHFSIRNITNGATGGYSWHDETYGKMKANGVVYWGGKAGGDTKVFNMELFMLRFSSTVEGWRDSRNMFSNDDNIEIETSDTGYGALRTYVNYAPAINIQDIGSKPIIAPVGESIIKITTSTFSKNPVVKATIRERYL